MEGKSGAKAAGSEPAAMPKGGTPGPLSDAANAHRAVADAIQHFRVACYRVTLRAESRMRLPPFKGAALRGGFGLVFRDMCCVHRGSHCQTCPLDSACPYSYVFETRAPGDTGYFPPGGDVPRPFVLEPPLDPRTDYHPGDRLEFRLLLFGRAIPYFPYFLAAFRELGRRGFGKGGGCFQVQEARTLHPPSGKEVVVYSGPDDHARNIALAVTGAEVAEEATRLPDTHVIVEFLTMTRLKSGAHYQDTPEFEVLARSLMRRASSISALHHGVSLELDYRALVAAARRVEVVESDTRWVDWSRYSLRQDTTMKLGGIVGRATYQGDLRPFRELLVLGTYLHAGKNPTFGLGRYRLLPVEK